MKSDRLLSILLLLQTRGRVPAAELAERLEVSVRTVYRDIESLSTAGVPVYAERGRHGGIALLPGFRTDVTGMTSDEARALFVLAAQGAHSALGLEGALGSALRKIMAALPAPHRPAAELTSRRILVDPERWRLGHGGGSEPAAVVDLDVLNTAVFADRRLRISYRHGGEREQHTYTVDPYGLVAKAGVWYLVADLRGRGRLFRADRVAWAKVLDTPVQRRTGVELADAWDVLRHAVEDRPVAVRVRARVRRSRLSLFLRISASMLDGTPPTADGGGAEDGDGPEGEGGGEGVEETEWVEVRLAYPAEGAVRQLLQFGADVEVLDPPEVQTELARIAAEITDLYAPGRR